MHSIFPIGMAIGIRMVCAGMLAGMAGCAIDVWNDKDDHPWPSRIAGVGLVAMGIGLNIVVWSI